MFMHPRRESKVPEETARVAQAAFPKGNDYMTLRDELETIYTDSQFAPLYELHRRPIGGQTVLTKHVHVKNGSTLPEAYEKLEKQPVL